MCDMQTESPARGPRFHQGRKASRFVALDGTAKVAAAAPYALFVTVLCDRQ